MELRILEMEMETIREAEEIILVVIMEDSMAIMVEEGIVVTMEGMEVTMEDMVVIMEEGMVVIHILQISLILQITKGDMIFQRSIIQVVIRMRGSILTISCPFMNLQISMWPKPTLTISSMTCMCLRMCRLRSTTSTTLGRVISMGILIKT